MDIEAFMSIGKKNLSNYTSSNMNVNKLYGVLWISHCPILHLTHKGHLLIAPVSLNTLLHAPLTP